jgi:Terminase small subunit
MAIKGIKKTEELLKKFSWFKAEYKSDVLRGREGLFVLHFEGNGTEAAIKAGCTKTNASNYAWAAMKRPRVLKAIAAKQAAMTQESGKDLAKGVTITRNDIINRLDTISKTAESESARVSALSQLVNIFGLNPKHADTDLFAGWTDEELEHYRATGELPARFGPSLGTSGSDSGDSNPPA